MLGLKWLLLTKDLLFYFLFSGFQTVWGNYSESWLVIKAIRPDLKRVEEEEGDVFDSNARFQENVPEDDQLQVMLEDYDSESEVDPMEDPFYDEFL